MEEVQGGPRSFGGRSRQLDRVKSPWMEMETEPHHQLKRQGLSPYARSPEIFQVSLWLVAEGIARPYSCQKDRRNG